MRKLVYLLIFLPNFVAAAGQEPVLPPEDQIEEPCEAKVDPWYPLLLTPDQADEVLGPYVKFNFSGEGGPGPLIRKALDYLLSNRARSIKQVASNLKIFLRRVKAHTAVDRAVSNWSFLEFVGHDGSYIYIGGQYDEPKVIVLKPNGKTVEIYKGKIEIAKYFPNQVNRWPGIDGYNTLTKEGVVQTVDEN